ncbi:MAG: response regulator, partial [Candidatus Bathyarchaeota archaeon]|nr:response regulator [Candidatus Bathyarchaeota archaeon]
ILESEGYHVDTASTGRQAIENIGKNEYQVVILDMKLPDMQGIEVAREIRNKTDEINLIIMTGYPNLVDSIEALDIGISEILLKPINADEFLRTVEEALVDRKNTAGARQRQ